jgi:hypothetical protein
MRWSVLDTMPAGVARFNKRRYEVALYRLPAGDAAFKSAIRLSFRQIVDR